MSENDENDVSDFFVQNGNCTTSNEGSASVEESHASSESTPLLEQDEYKNIQDDDLTNKNVLDEPPSGSNQETAESGIELAWDAEFPSNNPTDESATAWRKLSDRGGTYYWNVETGVTQFSEPSNGNIVEHKNRMDSVDSSLADLEDAAFRYASITLGDDSLSDSSSKWACDSDNGHMFSVRSMGWLPMETCSNDPAKSSADVNSCIKHLSKSHGQIMDGVGAWGDGKNLLLLIEDENLKLLDPLNQTVLQTQAIKYIRVWGVGRDSAHDFAYVAKDTLSKSYKCHVFRCDASARAIARELHLVCESLSLKHKNTTVVDEELEKEKVAMSTPIPVPKTDPGKDFPVKYLGYKVVEAVNGIQTVKNVIREITTDDTALCVDCIANVNTNALTITGKQDGGVLVSCRMRCLSFMGIGDDISLFAFISAVPNEMLCHVIQCQPNAAKLALAVQEACILRFQKAVDSNQTTVPQTTTEHSRSSIRQSIRRVFSLKRKKSFNT